MDDEERERRRKYWQQKWDEAEELPPIPANESSLTLEVNEEEGTFTLSSA